MSENASNNSANAKDLSKNENFFIKYLLAAPTVPLILGSIMLFVAGLLDRAGDVKTTTLLPEYIYGFALLILGFWLMISRGTTEPKGFLGGISNPVVRKVIRFAPLIASFTVFYIVSAIVRGSDKVGWGDIILELLVSAGLLVLGVFFIIKS